MKYLNIALAVLAASTGLVAAYKWFRASGTPTWATLNNSAALNREAALWTAASVLLSGISTLLGALG
jgi:hypothetical protein